MEGALVWSWRFGSENHISNTVLVPTRVGRLAVTDIAPAGVSEEIMVFWPSILANRRIYDRQIEAFRSRHRLVLIDGPGHGESGPAPSPFSMYDCGQAVIEVLDSLKIVQPVVFVGTSWGGLVAGEFALTEPRRTRALVMLNTPVQTKPSGPSLGDRFVVWGARWIHKTSIYRNGVAKAFFLPRTRKGMGLLLKEFHQHLLEANGTALEQAVKAVLIEREALAPRMKQITVPTLFIAGRYDEMYPVEALRSAAAALPQGRFEVLETAHISVVDQPALVNTLIDDFLQQRFSSLAEKPI